MGFLWPLLYIEPIKEYKFLNRQKNTVTYWGRRDPPFMEPIKEYKVILAIKLIKIFNVEDCNVKNCEVT